ncbi:putative serine protein kinase, PrkA [Ammonifex degensii KC4]|uniref:Serine protein kinase, PrkA n=1 Tax=Ammonifex degensii (strain DSM 10501 / KC4) TaxID=429009 RepID=C9RD73_AMMDK|nr:protein PrkA [Ammonifex degensii]ACX52200.1 putative serine protein kinase, PrkA [Ammonifex degensii KC4]
MGFWQRLQEYRDREASLRWEGTFRDYLELVRRKPWICQLAHSRIYQMILSAGVEEVNGRRRYLFFTRELFGLEEVIEKLVEEYLRPAAEGLDVRRRILLLVGPVGGGKSTLVNLLKQGLEEYSRTEEGAVYAIKGCPMHEEPLHLIPPSLRPEFEREYGIRIEGDLCPLCRLRLETEFGGRIEEVPVERIFFSEEKRIGIGTFAPSDPKSQDIAELTGSVDFSTITRYGAESDPRAYCFDGELNVANRGIMEFMEMLKCDERFLWNLIFLAQEGNFKAGRFALIYADEMIIGHSNETEYKAFIANRRNEALLSRMIVLRVPYNLRVSEEIKIYEKLLRQSNLKGVHVAPHALRAAAMFSVLSRLKESHRQGVDLVKKMRLYDGEEVEGFTPADVEELRAEHPDEGMSGVDPRYVINRLCVALTASEGKCLTALEVLRSLKEGLDQHPSITPEDKERILSLISLVRREYDELVKKDVQKALLASFETAAQAIFERYLDNLKAYCRGIKRRDPLSGKEILPEEDFMCSLELQIGIGETAKRSFREEIFFRLSAYARQGKSFSYRDHEGLREAVERKLLADLREMLRLALSSPEQGRLEEVKERLMRLYGYCPWCAKEAIHYVGSMLCS